MHNVTSLRKLYHIIQIYLFLLCIDKGINLFCIQYNSLVVLNYKLGKILCQL